MAHDQQFHLHILQREYPQEETYIMNDITPNMNEN